MLQSHPHRRFNPLTGEWVLVSPHRTRRPWQGQEEAVAGETLPRHDPDCYLCAGNARAGGAVNPDYADTFVFTNDFAALLPEKPDDGPSDTPTGPTGGLPAAGADLFRAEPETGICRVVCFSPRHDLSISRMRPEQVGKVVDLWCDEFAALGGRESIGYVQIFENRGAVMGCSNPHPHGQIWATASVPTIPEAEDRSQKAHLAETGECLLCRYLRRELELDERIIFENRSFVALVPFWALWPFEVMLLPKEHQPDITAMSTAQRADLAEALVRMGTRYDNLFKTSFPYSMGLHQRPTKGHDGRCGRDGRDGRGWHWHIHYYPPLLRSATVRKFMVGFEMFGMPQRDITAESAAARLRELSEVHYLGEGA